MNAFTQTITDLATTLKRFSTEPLAADLFSWCAQTGTDTRLRSRLELLRVPFTAATPVLDLKRKLERRIAVEPDRIKDKRSPDINRLIALKQALGTVEKFQQAA